MAGCFWEAEVLSLLDFCVLLLIKQSGLRSFVGTILNIFRFCFRFSILLGDRGFYFCVRAFWEEAQKSDFKGARRLTSMEPVAMTDAPLSLTLC